MSRSSLLVLVLVLACAVAAVTARRLDARTRQSVQMGMAEKTAEQLGSHAGLVAHINAVAAQMRAEQAAGAKGTLCKTVYNTDEHEFPYSRRFLEKYSEYIPDTQKSISIFLQAEVSAKAFVGIGASIGMGLDFNVDVKSLRPTKEQIAEGIRSNALNPALMGAAMNTIPPRLATGQVRLFACIGASLSIGHVGASVSAGGGVLVGFGQYRNSIMASDLEIGVDVGLGIGASVGLLVHVEGGGKAFKRALWTDKQQKAITDAEAAAPQREKKGKLARSLAFMKKCAKTGIDIIGSTVVGVHLAAGVSAGASAGVAVELDGEAVIGGIKDGFKAIWNTRFGKWLSKKLGNNPIVKRMKSIGAKLGNLFSRVDKKASEYFDYAPIADKVPGENDPEPSDDTTTAAPTTQPSVADAHAIAAAEATRNADATARIAALATRPGGNAIQAVADAARPAAPQQAVVGGLVSNTRQSTQSGSKRPLQRR